MKCRKMRQGCSRKDRGVDRQVFQEMMMYIITRMFRCKLPKDYINRSGLISEQEIHLLI